MSLSNTTSTMELHNAVIKGDLELVQRLIDQENITQKSNSINIAFLTAAKYNHYNLIKFLVNYLDDVNIVDEWGRNALGYAVSNNNLMIISLLIQIGANLNALTPSGFSALHLAAAHNAVDCAVLLLDSGSNINAQDVDGMTPLMTAVDTGDYIIGPGVARILIERGADLNIKDNDGETILEYFTQYRSSMTADGQQLYELIRSKLQ